MHYNALWQFSSGFNHLFQIFGFWVVAAKVRAVGEKIISVPVLALAVEVELCNNSMRWITRSHLTRASLPEIEWINPKTSSGKYTSVTAQLGVIDWLHSYSRTLHCNEGRLSSHYIIIRSFKYLECHTGH